MHRNTSNFGLKTFDNKAFQSAPVQQSITDLNLMQQTEVLIRQLEDQKDLLSQFNLRNQQLQSKISELQIYYEQQSKHVDAQHLYQIGLLNSQIQEKNQEIFRLTEQQQLQKENQQYRQKYGFRSISTQTYSGDAQIKEEYDLLTQRYIELEAVSEVHRVMFINRMDEIEKWKEMLYQSEKVVIKLQQEIKHLREENDALMQQQNILEIHIKPKQELYDSLNNRPTSHLLQSAKSPPKQQSPQRFTKIYSTKEFRRVKQS